MSVASATRPILDDERGTACAAVVAAVTGGHVYAALTGPPGSGKTVALGVVATYLRHAGHRVLPIAGANEGGISLRDIIEQIAGKPLQDDQAAEMDDILDALTGTADDTSSIVVTVDDAHLLQTDAIEFFRLVAMLGRNGPHATQVVFAGRLNFWEVVGDTAPGALGRKITQRVTLEALPEPAPDPEPAVAEVAAHEDAEPTVAAALPEPVSVRPVARSWPPPAAAPAHRQVPRGRRLAVALLAGCAVIGGGAGYLQVTQRGMNSVALMSDAGLVPAARPGHEPAMELAAAPLMADERALAEVAPAGPDAPTAQDPNPAVADYAEPAAPPAIVEVPAAGDLPAPPTPDPAVAAAAPPEPPSLPVADEPRMDPVASAVVAEAVVAPAVVPTSADAPPADTAAASADPLPAPVVADAQPAPDAPAPAPPTTAAPTPSEPVAAPPLADAQPVSDPPSAATPPEPAAPPVAVEVTPAPANVAPAPPGPPALPVAVETQPEPPAAPSVADAPATPDPPAAEARPEPASTPVVADTVAVPLGDPTPPAEAAPADPVAETAPPAAVVTETAPPAAAAPVADTPTPPPPQPAPSVPAAATPAVVAVPAVPVRVPVAVVPPEPTSPPPAPVRKVQATPPRAATADPTLVAALLRRGDALVGVGDISAARLVYTRAAAAGSAVAATALGRTYDPAYLTSIGVRGIAGDPAIAAEWYRRAIALGDAEAGGWLRQLGTR